MMYPVVALSLLCVLVSVLWLETTCTPRFSKVPLSRARRAIGPSVQGHPVARHVSVLLNSVTSLISLFVQTEQFAYILLSLYYTCDL